MAAAAAVVAVTATATARVNRALIGALQATKPVVWVKPRPPLAVLRQPLQMLRTL